MKALPFYLLLITTFTLAGVGKLGPATPDWFLRQFSGTVLDLFPGALGLTFYLLALLELATAGLLLAGLGRREFLPGATRPLLSAGIMLAQVVFVLLCFGQRLTHQYDAAASLFAYAALTFLAGRAALSEA